MGMYKVPVFGVMTCPELLNGLKTISLNFNQLDSLPEHLGKFGFFPTIY